MGTVERFANGRALAAYAGLLPLDNKSADKNIGKKTGYHSNRYLKWAVLEGVNGMAEASDYDRLPPDFWVLAPREAALVYWTSDLSPSAPTSFRLRTHL
jgi:hypothetical protein